MHVDQLAAAAGNESFDFVLSECQEDGTKLAGVDGVPYIIVTPNGEVIMEAVLELETGADQLEEAEEIVFTNEYEKPAPVPGDKLDPTGDTTPVALIAVLAAVALLALLVVLVVMRRRNRA